MVAVYRTTCIECGAPRDPAAPTGRCALHQHEHSTRLRRAHRSRHPGYAAIHSRLTDYATAAQAAGAVGWEVTRIVMACDIEHERLNGRRPQGWIARVVARELDYLRAHRELMEQLDIRMGRAS